VRLLVPQVTGVFPVRVPQVTIEEPVLQLLGRFNLLSVQLLSRLMVAGGSDGVVGGEGASRGWQGQLLQSVAGKGLGLRVGGVSADFWGMCLSKICMGLSGGTEKCHLDRSA
jgi:hypothetical protein